MFGGQFQLNVHKKRAYDMPRVVLGDALKFIGRIKETSQQIPRDNLLQILNVLRKPA